MHEIIGVKHIQIHIMKLTKRPRRLRTTSSMRSLTQEHHVQISDLMLPIFVTEGENVKEEISSMPGYYRYSLDTIGVELEEVAALGIKAVLLFVKAEDELKDNKGTESYNPDGLMQRAIKKIKSEQPDLAVFTDVALDPYSSYGHDGIVEDGKILNDETVEVLVKMAVSHAEAGADFVAPSDMMDGRIGAIREGLDTAGFKDVGIMAYSAKYASCFYGPFRDALDSAPGFGDKKTYQMNPANVRAAEREIILDIEEGADMVMVKPGLPYLDVVRAASECSEVPVSVYHVSGEYAMIKAASEKGWLNEDEAIMEVMHSFKRAGADLIATYFAKDVAKVLRQN